MISVAAYFVSLAATGFLCGLYAAHVIRRERVKNEERVKKAVTKSYNRGFDAGTKTERALWEARLADDGSGETLGQKRDAERVNESAKLLADELGVTSEVLMEAFGRTREEIEAGAIPGRDKLAEIGNIAVDLAIDGGECLTCLPEDGVHYYDCPVGQWLAANPEYRKEARADA